MVNKNISGSEESRKSIRDKEKRGRYIKRLISIDREIDRITEEKVQLDKESKDLLTSLINLFSFWCTKFFASIQDLKQHTKSL